MTVVRHFRYEVTEEGLVLSFFIGFELSLDEAKNETKRIKDTVNKNWQLLAKEYGLSKSDVERMEAAFALCMD